MEEVLELVFKARSGDSHAFSRLARVYKPLLNSLTQRYLKMCQNDGEIFDDFVQEAQMALFEAVKTYDENSGFTFGAYAKSCIIRFCGYVLIPNKLRAYLYKKLLRKKSL